MDESDARLARMEARLSLLEDQIALYQLMSLYGPLVDSGQAGRAAALWTEDGLYDWGAGPVADDVVSDGVVVEGAAGAARGRAALAGMVEGAFHQAIIAGGAGHVIGLPHITLMGDRARAISYSRLYRREGDGFQVWRVAANAWDFVRTAEGWRVERRINRLLDGQESARALLAGVGQTGLGDMEPG